MHLDTLVALSVAATRLKMSRRDVIVRLLMRIMRDIDSFPGGFKTVTYQPDDAKERWHCFSIKFKHDENEYFTDLRNVCKCSVSLLVGIAVKKYLDELLNDIEKAIYNYKPFSCYMLQREDSCGIICWRIYWGIPTKERIMQIE